MDPWNCDPSTIASSQIQQTEVAKRVFDNSFLGGGTGGPGGGRLDKPVCHTTTNTVTGTSRLQLSDSNLYVSKLEERLRRVQQCGSASGSEHNSSGRKSDKSSELSEQLRQAKEDAIIRLVRSSSASALDEEDLELDEELTTSYLYRRLAPQKTALTKGEKVLLLAADQLAVKLAESEVTDSCDDRRNTSEDALEEN